MNSKQPEQQTTKQQPPEQQPPEQQPNEMKYCTLTKHKVRRTCNITHDATLNSDECKYDEIKKKCILKKSLDDSEQKKVKLEPQPHNVNEKKKVKIQKDNVTKNNKNNYVKGVVTEFDLTRYAEKIDSELWFIDKYRCPYNCTDEFKASHRLREHLHNRCPYNPNREGVIDKHKTNTKMSEEDLDEYLLIEEKRLKYNKLNHSQKINELKINGLYMKSN